MTDITTAELGRWVGRTAKDRGGEKIGKIEDVYIDDDSGQPEWVAVTTGLFGSRVSFVPVQGAREEGEDVVLGFDKAMVKDAPNMDADGALSPAEEDQLYAHYGLTAMGDTGTADVATGYSDVDTTTTVDTTVDVDTTAAAVDVAPSGMTDDAMTRSEEELDVGTTTREAGRARLRKWVETENVTTTVPVQREKAVLVTEAVTDANRDQALSGVDITEGEHEVVLSEEVVDVSKRVVPKERVRLETETETEEVVVDEEVRRERIALEGDDPTRTS